MVFVPFHGVSFLKLHVFFLRRSSVQRIFPLEPPILGGPKKIQRIVPFEVKMSAEVNFEMVPHVEVDTQPILGDRVFKKPEILDVSPS